MMNSRRLVIGVVIGLCTCASARSWALEMCWIFGSGMVLQADRPLPVWGQADPGESVRVSFAGQAKTATADSSGEWSLKLDSLAISGKGREFRVEAKSGTKVFTNVLVGDVWICSGQSNMAQPSAEKAAGGEEEAKKPVNPLLRSFSVAYNNWAAEPNTRNFAWDKKVTNWFDWGAHGARISAVPYFFGKTLQEQTGRPIGLIITPVGASNAEAWVPMKALEPLPEFAGVVASSKQWMTNMPEARKQFQMELAGWEERKKAAEASGKAFKERQPNDFKAELVPRFWVGAMYNARIAPLRNLAITGVIWYQGENNAAGHGGCTSDRQGYEKLMKVLIDSWRAQFERSDLPFYQVQLSMFNWKDVTRNPNDPGSWSVIREAQERVARGVPCSGLAVSVDIGEKDNIHPANKRPVGERLARLALRDVYKQDVVAEGPRYESHAVEDGTVRIRFKNTQGGLKVNGEKLAGFAIAGELPATATNGAASAPTFVWAEAKVDGNDVIVWNDQVKKPLAVRYGYAQYIEVNLANGAGLPAMPFRTDDWLLVNAKKSGSENGRSKK